MAILLRQNEEGDMGGRATDDGRREDAIDTFRRRDVDTDGLSVFEVSTDEERDLVVAAIACSRASDNPVDLLEIPRAVIESYGAIAVTPGNTPVSAANRLHRSLDWDAAMLQRLAIDLFNAGAQATRVKSADVRSAVRRLAADAVEGERAKTFVDVQRAKRAP